MAIGNRVEFDVKDILTKEDSEIRTELGEEGFEGSDLSGLFQAKNILHNNFVTVTDVRKQLIDIEGVRNAWVRGVDRLVEDESYGINYSVKPAEDAQGESFLQHDTGETSFAKPVNFLQGLYDIVIEFEEDLLEADRPDKLQEATAVLHQYRNLCEDYDSIRSSDGREEICVLSNIDIAPNANPEELLAKIYFELYQYLSPSVTFRTIAQMKEFGLKNNEIFTGPALTHGFILDEDVISIKKRTQLFVSDMIRIIMGIEGVESIRDIAAQNIMEISNSSIIDQLKANIISPGTYEVDKEYLLGEREEWCLPLFQDVNVKNLSLELALRPFFDATGILENLSSIQMFKAKIPVTINEEKLLQHFDALRLAAIRSRRETKILDLVYPDGSTMDLSDFNPVQNDLPETFGSGLAGISNEEPDLRKGQVKQLKGYLMFYEQILANYLQQLDSARKLFELEKGDRTYYSQLVDNIKDRPDLYSELQSGTDNNALSENDFKTLLLADLEQDVADGDPVFDRKNRLFDHLLARFNEFFNDYSLVMFGLNKQDQLLEDKVLVLKDYPNISKNRGKGFDYTKRLDSDSLLPDVWGVDSINSTGFQQRIARFLGYMRTNREYLAPAFDLSLGTVILELQSGPVTYYLNTVDYTAEEALKLLLQEAGRERIVYVEDGSEVKIYLAPYVEADLATHKLFATSATVVDTSLTIDETKYYFANAGGVHLVEHILLRPTNDQFDFLEVNVEADLDFFYKKNYILSLEEVDVAAGEYLLTLNHPSIGAAYSKIKLTLKLGNTVFRIGQKTGPLTEQTVLTGDINASDEDVIRVGSSFRNYVLVDNEGANKYSFLIKEVGVTLAESREYTSKEARDYNLVQVLSVLYKANPLQSFCKADEDPYSFRATVLIPSWSQKSNDYAFREHAENTIRLEAPAHVALDFLWVDVIQMRAFEECFRNWLSIKSIGDDFDISNSDHSQYLSPTEQSEFSALATDLEKEQYLDAMANCVIGHLNGIVDVFTAAYRVSFPRTMDSYKITKINAGDPDLFELWAYVQDSFDSADILVAELINGSSLPAFAKLVDQVNILSTYAGAKVQFISAIDGGTGDPIVEFERDVQVGDIIITDPNVTITDATAENIVVNVFQIDTEVEIQTVSAEGQIEDQKVRLRVLPDVEDSMVILPNWERPCYKNNQLIASFDEQGTAIAQSFLYAGENLPAWAGLVKRIDGTDVIVEIAGTETTLTGGLQLYVLNSINPDGTRSEGAARDAIPGDIYVHNESAVATTSFAGFSTQLVTVDIGGGISVIPFSIKVREDSYPELHALDNIDWITEIENPGNLVITVHEAQLSKGNLVRIADDSILLFPGGVTQDANNPAWIELTAITAGEHEVFMSIGTGYVTNQTFDLSFEVTDICNVNHEIFVELTIIKDVLADVDYYPIELEGCFAINEPVAKIDDENGAITTFTTTVANVLASYGLYYQISGGDVYIKVQYPDTFDEALKSGGLSVYNNIENASDPLNGRAIHILSFEFTTTDLYGGVTTKTVTLQALVNTDAVILTRPGISYLCYYRKQVKLSSGFTYLPFVPEPYVVDITDLDGVAVVDLAVPNDDDELNEEQAQN